MVVAVKLLVELVVEAIVLVVVVVVVMVTISGLVAVVVEYNVIFCLLFQDRSSIGGTASWRGSPGCCWVRLPLN